MKPLKELITADQQTYIRKHVDFLCCDKRVISNRFDMQHYGSPSCDNAGCSAGWMQVSMDDSQAHIKTDSYFGINEWNYKTDRLTKKWEWCFAMDWKKTDNTAIGAAARLLYLLEYGLPCNHKEIMKGKAPYPVKITKWIEKVKQMKGKK